MSKYLNSASTYLKLLSDKDTPKDQKLGLINTASKKQIFALVEIIHNILSGTISLSNKAQKIVRKHQVIFNKFIKPKKTLQSKTRALKTHYKLFSQLLEEVKGTILK